MRSRSVVFVPLLGVMAWLMATLVGAGPALAEADSEYVREGVSMSLAGVYALENTDQRWKNLDDTGGVHFRADARIAPGMSFGIYGEWLHYDGRDPIYAGVILKIFPMEAFDMSLLGGRLQPYFMGAAGVIFVEDRFSNDQSAGGNFRGGGGLDIYLTKHVFTYGEVHYSGAGGDPSGIESTNFLAGLGWRF